VLLYNIVIVVLYIVVLVQPERVLDDAATNRYVEGARQALHRDRSRVRHGL